MCGVRLAGILSAGYEVVLPCLCLHCGEPVGGDRVGLCASCWTFVGPGVGAGCERCGGPAADRPGPCLSCHASPPPQLHTVVWGEYDGPLRSALLALKGGGHDELAVVLGRRLAFRLATTDWVDDIEIVTAVPSHPIRRLRIGWPAAGCIARIVAADLNRPFRWLLRRHGVDRQTGRSRGRRMALPHRALSSTGRAAGKRVLVVDDVMTTGTTLARSAAALLRAGADAVYCAAMAATPDARRVT
jgi:predicted amidophosphoribosyltransferase